MDTITLLTILSIIALVAGVIMVAQRESRPTGALLIVIAIILGFGVSLTHAQRDSERAYIDTGIPSPR